MASAQEAFSQTKNNAEITVWMKNDPGVVPSVENPKTKMFEVNFEDNEIVNL